MSFSEIVGLISVCYLLIVLPLLLIALANSGHIPGDVPARVFYRRLRNNQRKFEKKFKTRAAARKEPCIVCGHDTLHIYSGLGEVKDHWCVSCGTKYIDEIEVLKR